MAFNRSTEGPMEFEYERQPFFSYNIFNVPYRDPDIVMTDPNDHKPPEHSPVLDEVSSHLGEINLNDQPVKEPELIHREIQTDEFTPSDDSLSSPPHTPPATTPDLPVISKEPQQSSSSQHLHIYPSPHDPPREDFAHMAKGLISVGCTFAWFVMAVYLFVQFALAMREDINMKLKTFESDRLDEFLNCQMEYANNRCDPSTRVPAMDELCRQWQKCLYRPMWLATTRAFAEILADMTNGFVDQISMKTMLCLLMSLAITLWSFSYTGSSRPSQPGAAYPAHPKTPEERKRIAWSD
ncbi:Di-sulfide bridge nucleocytoplasmic transport domain-containing protein [Fennellomyces sp. T-0311]|nr:Di-sulfide bridge nucleocytoplasmic transport domain-containing protein [Fennellomyces sp. T-0311]